MTKHKVKDEVDLSLPLYEPQGAYYGNPIKKTTVKKTKAELKIEKEDAKRLQDAENASHNKSHKFDE